MKRATITTALVCLIIDIVICTAVCIQWKALGCSTCSLLAAIIFYSVGCCGLYICIREFVRIIYRLEKKDDPYGPDEEDF